jgi:hypothetical protein
MTTPLEANARLLIGVLAKHFPTGATCEDLRRRFEKNTSLARQSFYNALRYAKEQGWFVGGGMHRLYSLNPDGTWKEPPVSVGAPVGEQLEAAKRNNDRLEYLMDLQEGRIEGLQGEVEYLRDWSSGGVNGVAVSNLAQIVSDSTASLRQRLKAAAVVLGYRVQDADVIAFTKRFLESLCANADIPTDYRIEAGELLRRSEDAMIRPPIERLPARTDDVKAEEPVIPLADLVAQRRARHDRMMLEPPYSDLPKVFPSRPNGDGNGQDGSSGD